MKKYLGLILILILSLSLVVGCNSSASKDEESKKVELAYVEWTTAVASNNVVKVVLEEKLGYDVELTSVTAPAMYQSVAMGDVDGLLCSWVPTMQGHYIDQFGDDMVALGPNLEGTKVGLVVPDYVEIDSITELNENADKFNGQIVGMDPGSGVVHITKSKTLDGYGLTNIELLEGSDATMTAALGDAIKNNEWIAITGWNPHWMFARWDLKYLDDPKGFYGEAERVETFVRKGLKEDMPEVYNLLDKFYWTSEDMEQVMIWNEEEGADPYKNAKRWVEENEDKVSSWLE
ncbi:glycine betaine/proline transport system substrate-binding protein [Desulfonispora thiosulfatigenes DSM 11270]|uniref:Glycine betaine/proline transport system substrate-binding protein n=1 Tax=Desulfonispora thiosulfatigenes DSM 11270 TaxID=656914 RepID=A0A1W1V3P1_DESTI|nr:glycine betaine ABC transporter substrate-binding protein [Desulfonispora thiosulfatigenes]SMB87661.1 glycine betaine/proline transport system substrate-binding protein [Desulfonispora thiosulfatigenes DSM 11270]